MFDDAAELQIRIKSRSIYLKTFVIWKLFEEMAN